MNDPLLQLRDDAQEVRLVLENGATRPVIGNSEPAQGEDEEAVRKRLRVARHWGVCAAPRKEEEGGITEPLDLRKRTILACRLPEAARRALAEGRVGHGKVPESGVLARWELGPR